VNRAAKDNDADGLGTNVTIETESARAEPLRAKLEEWRGWMDVRTPNSITSQLYQMVWDDAVYRIINECRRLAPPAEEGGAQLNGMIHGFIDGSHFRLQPLAIRRVLEKRSDVVSLGRLLEDFRGHAHLMTRGAFFEAEGLPYDHKAAEAALQEHRWKTLEQARAAGRSAAYLDPAVEEAWHWAERLHADFDRFSKTKAEARSPEDSLDAEFIDALWRRLKVCEGVRQYVNKQIAHAADPASLRQLPDEARKLSLARLEECHKAICGVASFVSVHLLRGAQLSFLATPQYNQYAYIEKPWVAEEEIAQLDGLWSEFDRTTDEWGVPEWPEGW
jgi:hypothetical protein